MATFSVLSLGTRRDAKQFRKGAMEKLSLSAGSVVNAPKPPLDDIKKLFARTDEVLFLAGHYAGSLYNEDHSIDLAFDANKLTVKYDAQTAVLNRGAEFKQTKCKLVIWGGCSVCNDTATIDTMRALFVGERYADFGREFSQALERRDRRVLRCRQTFIESDAQPLGVVENKVGKRPSNIEADTMSWFGHDTTIRFARP
jgi:hypothetical protein